MPAEFLPERDVRGLIVVAARDRKNIPWSAGDYAIVGTTLQIVGETLCEALDRTK